MANEKNLKRLSPSEARINGKKGGKARAKKMKERKLLRELLQMELEELKTFREGRQSKEVTKAVYMVKALVKEACKGNVQAFNSARDLLGEKPAEKISADIKTDVSAEFVNVFLDKFKKGKK